MAVTLVHVAPRSPPRTLSLWFCALTLMATTRLAHSLAPRAAALRPVARATVPDSRTLSALPHPLTVNGYAPSWAPSGALAAAPGNVLSSQTPLKTGAEVLAQLEADIARNRTLNVGRAIETIRDEVPLLFEQAPTTSIFSNAVKLTDQDGTQLIPQGIRSYSYFLASLRMSKKWGLVKPYVEITSLRYLDWRSEISVRLTITTFGMRKDALFVYKLNDEGLINEHKIDPFTGLFDPPNLPLLNLAGLQAKGLIWGGHGGVPVPSGL